MITAAKAAIFHHFFLVCEYQVQPSITSSLLIDHLHQEISWSCQKTELLVPGCIALP